MDTRTYRDLIGHFATGVTVITTNNDGSLHGMTANAVTSVSLEPLLLLVCVARGARCLSEVKEAGRFGVNILTAEQEEVSQLFAQSREPEELELRGQPFHMGHHGTPLIDDALAHLECQVSEVLPGGDHDLVLGEVLGGEVTGSSPPLLFYGGRYRFLKDVEG